MTAGRRVCGLALLMLTATGGGASAAEQRVFMRAVDYAPRQITVRVGDTVLWVNEDIVAHTATEKDRAWEVAVQPGETGRVSMSRPGSVDYDCRYHPNMTGTIVVVP